MNTPGLGLGWIPYDYSSVDHVGSVEVKMAPSLARLVAHAYVSLCLLCFWLPRVGASQLPTVDKFAAVIKSLANEGMGSHEFQVNL